MKRISLYIGIGLIVVGVACFVVHSFMPTSGNWLLLVGLAAVIVGTVADVRSIKRG